MAEAFFNAAADPQAARALSAGIEPAAAINAAVIATMREAGIDLGVRRPQGLTPELVGQAQVLVSVGGGVQVPDTSGLERLSWSIPDPEDQEEDFLDAIRDEIRARVLFLLQERGWARS